MSARCNGNSAHSRGHPVTAVACTRLAGLFRSVLQLVRLCRGTPPPAHSRQVGVSQQAGRRTPSRCSPLIPSAEKRPGDVLRFGRSAQGGAGDMIGAGRGGTGLASRSGQPGQVGSALFPPTRPRGPAASHLAEPETRRRRAERSRGRLVSCDLELTGFRSKRRRGSPIPLRNPTANFCWAARFLGPSGQGRVSRRVFRVPGPTRRRRRARPPGPACRVGRGRRSPSLGPGYPREWPA